MATAEELQNQPIWVQDLLVWLEKIKSENVEGKLWCERVKEVLLELPLQQLPLEYWDKVRESEEFEKSVQNHVEINPLVLTDEDSAQLEQEFKLIENIGSDEEQCIKIIEIIAQIPDSATYLLQQALNSIQNLRYDYSKVLALAAIVDKLPVTERQVKLQEALEITQNITSGYYRIEGNYYRVLALAEIAAHLSTAEHQVKLQEALKIVESISRVAHRSEALAAVAEQLFKPERHIQLQKALKLANTLADEEWRSQTLKAVITKIPPDEIQLLQQSLELALNIKDEEYFSRVLAEIVMKIPHSEISLLQRALDATTRIENEKYHSKALVNLAKQIPSSETQLIQQILGLAIKIEKEEYRSQVLLEIIAKIPCSEIHLIQKALESATKLKDENYRSQLLAAVANQIPSSKRQLILQKSLDYCQYTGNDYYNLLSLITVIKKTHISEYKLIKQILKSATLVKRDEYTWQILISVINQIPLSNIQLLEDILDYTEEIIDEYYRSQVISAVFSKILCSTSTSTRKREFLKHKSLNIANKISSSTYFHAVKELSEQTSLSNIQYIEKTLATIEEKDYSKNSDILVQIASQIPETESLLLERTLYLASKRPEALIAIINRIPASPSNLELLEKALVYAENTQSAWSRVKILTSLIGKFSDSKRQSTLVKALDCANTYRSDNRIEDEIIRFRMVESIAAQLPIFNADLFQDSLDIVTSCQDEALLAVFVSRFPVFARNEAIEKAFNLRDKDNRVTALTGLCCHSTEFLIEKCTPSQISMVLEVIPKLKTSVEKAKLLSALAPRLSIGLFPKALEFIYTEITHPAYQAEIIGNLSLYLSPEQLTESLDIIRDHIVGFSYPTAAICNLIPHLSLEQIKQALEIADEEKDIVTGKRIPQPELRTQIFFSIAKRISSINDIQSQPNQTDNKQNLVAHVFQYIESETIANEKSIAEIITAITPSLVCKDWIETILHKIIPKLNSEFYIAEVLAAITSKISDDQINTFLKITLNLRQERPKFRAISSLISAYPDKLPKTEVRVTKYFSELTPDIDTFISSYPHNLKEFRINLQKGAYNSPRDTDLAVIFASRPHPKEQKYLTALNSEQTIALRLIRTQNHDYDKANYLIQLAPHLLPSQAIEAQNIAQEIQDNYYKARSLVTLATHFPQVRKEAQAQINQLKYKSPNENEPKDKYLIQHIELMSQFATVVPEQIPHLLKTIEKWEEDNPFDSENVSTDPDRKKYKRTLILTALKPHLPIRLSREIDRETSIGKAPQDLWERCLFVLRNEYRQALKSGSFRNDTAQDEDLLNLKDEINALTEMLLMRDLTPPVAVGILGGWGGGKSYMMHLMQKHMVEIRSRGLDPVEAWGFKNKDDKNPDSSRLNRYVGHIYQIKFDAWTYAKSNLWASLMQTIFFELDRQISLEHQIDSALKRANPKTTPLDSQNGTIWQALYEVSDEDCEWFLKNVLTEQAFNEWEKLSKENSSSEKLWELFGNSQKDAIANLETLKSTLQKTKEDLQKKPVEILNNQLKRKAFFDTASQKAIAILQKRLGKNFTDEIKKDLKQKLTRIEDTTTDLNQFYDLVKDDIETVFEKKETQIDIQFIKEFTAKNYLFILICLSLIFLAILIPLALAQWVTNNLIAQIISATTPLIAAIPFAKTTIQRGRKLYNQIKLEVSDFTHKLENNIQNQIDSDKDLLALKTKITELEKEVKNKSADLPTNTYASIADFVKDRVQKGGYQEHLGMMHQVKEDLSMLSKRLLPPPADSKEYTTKVKQLAEVFPRGSARVVLYIDDLDRCPPKTVVEVLEAIQLLVKNPLFIAVLAIDERYISRALADHYKGVLPLKGRPSASDYLEKIIQIPYRIRPISEQALRQYLRAQIVVQDSETSGTKFNEFSPEEFNLLIACCQESELSPRSLKRLTNVYKLYKVLSRTRGQKPTPKEQKTILTLLAFSSRYPDLMRDILQKIGSIFDQSQNADNEKETLFNVFKTYLENPDKNSQNSYLAEDVKQLTYDFRKLVDEKLELNEIRSIFDFVRTFSFVGDIGVDHT